MALDIIENSEDPTFNATYRIPKCNELMKDRINYQWCTLFCNQMGIVFRCQKGKLAVSSEKQQEIEESVALHLGQVTNL